MGYDVKCLELAQTFLGDEEADEWMRNRASEDLAQQIQDLIESFIEYDLVEMRKERIEAAESDTTGMAQR